MHWSVLKYTHPQLWSTRYICRPFSFGCVRQSWIGDLPSSSKTNSLFYWWLRDLCKQHLVVALIQSTLVQFHCATAPSLKLLCIPFMETYLILMSKLTSSGGLSVSTDGRSSVHHWWTPVTLADWWLMAVFTGKLTTNGNFKTLTE